MARPMIHRSVPAPGELSRVVERRVGVQPKSAAPPGVRKPDTVDERAEQVQPVGEGVQPRERDVGRADLQRQHQVGEREHDRRREEQQHDRAVHGEQLVVLLRARGTACPDGPARRASAAPSRRRPRRTRTRSPGTSGRSACGRSCAACAEQRALLRLVHREGSGDDRLRGERGARLGSASRARLHSGGQGASHRGLEPTARGLRFGKGTAASQDSHLPWTRHRVGRASHGSAPRVTDPRPRVTANLPSLSA